MMSGFDEPSCILCRQPAKRATEKFHDAAYVRYQCPRCGMFLVSCRTESTLSSAPLKGKAPFLSLSAYTCARTIRCLKEGTPIACLIDHSDNPKEHSESPEGSIDFREASALFPKTISGRLDQTLINFGLLSAFPGDTFQLNENKYPVTYAENRQALLYILDQLKEENYLTYRRGASNQEGSVYNIQLTAKGWNQIAELERAPGGQHTRQVFISMWGHPFMTSIYQEGLKRGVEAAGYTAVRMDAATHPHKINDEAIAELRKSRFLVADFTGQRAGVYYQSGLATGLGMSVIATCRKDELDTLQFDPCESNLIVWEDADDLAKRLCYRIEATLGHYASAA